MMAAFRFRHFTGSVLVAGLIAAPVASFASDPVPPFSTSSTTASEDNVAADTSTATFDETAKWLTENLLSKGHSHYAKVVTIAGISTRLTTTETVVGAAVKGDVLELKVRSTFAGESPVRSEVTETLSLPLRLIHNVSASDGDPSLPPPVAARGQFTYVTVAISAEHNNIEDQASTRTTSPDDPPSISESTDILKTLNLHVDQSYDYCQRLVKALRHLAKLARAMPASNSAEPF